MRVMALPDGTYSDIFGCRIVELPDEYDAEQIEEALANLPDKVMDEPRSDGAQVRYVFDRSVPLTSRERIEVNGLLTHLLDQPAVTVGAPDLCATIRLWEQANHPPPEVYSEAMREHVEQTAEAVPEEPR